MTLVKTLTADEEAYILDRKLKRDTSHDYTKDPGFKNWLMNLTNKILDVVFPKELIE